MTVDVLHFPNRDEVPASVIASHVALGGVIVELGGHQGHTMLHLGSRLQASRYVVVEADPRNLLQLREACDRMGREVLCYAPMAICAASQCLPASELDRVFGGKQPFLFSLTGRWVRIHQSERDARREWTYSTSTCQPTQHLKVFPDVRFPHSVLVPAMTLDELMAEAIPSRIDLLWMDIEGAECGVLQTAAKETLTRVSALVLEAHQEALHEGSWSRAEAIAWLRDVGFELVATARQDIFLVRG